MMIFKDMRYIKNSFYLVILNLLLTPVAIAEIEILDYIVAVVNDDVIINSSLQIRVNEFEQKLRQKSKGKRMPPRRYLEKQILDRMILDMLQLQVAKNTGIKINNNLVNAQLRQVAAQQGLSLNNFRKKLEAEGYNYRAIREQLRQEMIIKRLQQRQIVSRIKLRPREIDNFLANQIQQGNISTEYHIQHILIALPETPSIQEIEIKKQKAESIVNKLKNGADFEATAVAVSDSRQALEGGDLGWLKPGELPLLFNKVINNMAIGDINGLLSDSSGFHIIKLLNKRNSAQSVITQTKARHILIKTNALISDKQAKIRLNRLKYRIQQGEDFAKLARSNSKDTTTSINGGALGWVSPGDLVAEFEEVMNRLSKNKISEAFKSRYGWHILQVLDRRKHDNTEQALRTRAAKQIRQRKINEELQNWLLQLRDQSYVEYHLDS
jgi:peptidyl-prolyl cis-trans isomerase SurA